MDGPFRLTDILIDVSRGNQRAIEFVDGLGDLWSMSDVTYRTVPVTGNIGERAYDLLKRYARSHGLRTFDSLIAATALELECGLATRNRKHFGMIKDLILDTPPY